MTRRITIRTLMAGIAGTALLLGSHQAGRRAEQLARPRPVMVWVTVTGKRYHREGCRYLRGGGMAVALDQVKASGRHRACAVCGPPG